MFYHSIISDWNHGNAHFLRGVVTELAMRGHRVRVYEDKKSWSFQNLVHEYGEAPMREFCSTYNGLSITRYEKNSLDLGRALDHADLVIVHEWNPHDLVCRIGEYRSLVKSFRLLFHDTHHRSVTDPDAIAAYDFRNYDGVLAFGGVIRDLYVDRGWIGRAWTWHEAADTRIFRPFPEQRKEGDLVWIGNWGDEERTEELKEYLLEPVKVLGLKARAYGVRYPRAAQSMLAHAGISYAGWLPNFHVPRVFSAYRVTVHIPRRPYAVHLPGIPTIRVFEALACGIPLICSPWSDAEGLFTPGRDYLVAKNGNEMKDFLRAVLNDNSLHAELAAHGLKTILSRHTCSHRVDELLRICREIGCGDRDHQENDYTKSRGQCVWPSAWK